MQSGERQLPGRALTPMTPSNERGFTLIELLVVIAILAILAAMTIPGLLRSRLSANEASAISTVRSTSSANVAYQAACGGYAVAFTTLADNRYLPEPLTGVAPVKSGYQFTLAVGAGGVPAGSGAGMCAGGQSAFFTSATPVLAGSSGRRSFALREPGTLFQDISGAPIADPPIIGGNVTVLQ